MKKLIKLEAIDGKIHININTLKYTRYTLYIDRRDRNNWITIEMSNLKSFIAEQKAQKETQINPVETTEVKPE